MTLIEPKCGPLGPDPTPKVGSIWGYSLDFTWISKLDQIQVQANNLGKPPNLNPFLGFCQAGGSNLGSIRVLLALRLRISSYFAVSSCFGHIQSQ